MKAISLSFLAWALLAPAAIHAAGEGTSAASFLHIGTGARPAAMGGAFCAVADDISAVQWNPSGLARLRAREVMFTHNEWIEGVRNEFIGYAQPFKDWTLGLTAAYAHTGGMVKRGISGSELGGNFGASGMALTAAGGKEISDKFSVGAGLKLVRETLDDKSAATFALDAGALYRYRRFTFGAALQNAGGSIKLNEDSFPLPLTLRLGASTSLVERATLSLEAEKSSDADIAMKAGAEWAASKKLSLRAGYGTGHDENAGPGISLGFGVDARYALIDYSFTPFGDLGAVHLLSLRYRF